MNKSVAEACSIVFDLGNDGREHLIALRNHERVLCKAGDAFSVSLGVEIDSGLLTEVDVLVHNHPGLTSLSAQDLSIAQFLNCEIIAVTQDESIYSAKVCRNHNIEAVRNRYLQICVEPLNMAVASAQCTTVDVSAICAHTVNLLLQRDGYIEYRYSIAEETRVILRKFQDSRTVSDKFLQKHLCVFSTLTDVTLEGA